MIERATSYERCGAWPSERAMATVTLGYDDRHRRRLKLNCDAGTPFLLDLPEAVALKSGDGLALENGDWIAVIAASEDLLEIVCPTQNDLLRIAWHLGNRHLPAEIHPDRIFIRTDHVIEEMLRGLGADVRSVRRPFEPEQGAYHTHGNGNGHSHGNGHAHSHG